MTAMQARAARAMLGMSTRELGAALGCSAMAISKMERGELGKGTGKLWLTALKYFHGRGLAFYAGGVILSDSSTVQNYADALRERFREGDHGSAYVAALDRILEAAVYTPAESE